MFDEASPAVPGRGPNVRDVRRNCAEDYLEAGSPGEPTIGQSANAGLGYFPEPYPEELIYSVLARCSRHLGHPPADRLNKLLFGVTRHRPNITFSSNLGLLASKLPGTSALTAGTMLFEHTVFPYYAAFMEPAKQATAIAARIAPRGTDTSVSANGWKWLHADKGLRFCPECTAGMQADYGEAYWRRVHQIPTVLVCPEHDRVLFRADMSGAGVRGWCAATPATCPDDAGPVVDELTEADRSTLREVATRSLGLLRGDIRIACRSTDRSGYQDLLVAKGLGWGSTFSNPSEIRKELLGRFGHLGRIWPEIFDATQVRGSGAIHRVAGKGGEITDPIMHILISMMLEGCPDVRPAFGHGPWACPNPIAQHGSDMPVTEITRRRAAGGTMVGRFTCSCGYVYAMSESEDGRQTKPVFRSFGPSLGPFLARAEAEGWGLQRTAQAIGLDLATLRSAAVAMNVDSDWLRPLNRGRWRRRAATSAISPGSMGTQEGE